MSKGNQKDLIQIILKIASNFRQEMGTHFPKDCSSILLCMRRTVRFIRNFFYFLFLFTCLKIPKLNDTLTVLFP